MNLSTRKISEVDKQVAQQLKNNQDFIYQTNQSLQNLSQGMIALSLQQEKILHKFESEKKDLCISVENMESQVKKSFSEMCKLLDGFRLQLDSQISFARGCVQSLPENFVQKNNHQAEIEHIINWLGHLENDIESLDHKIESNIHLVKGYCESKIDDLRKQVTNKPSEIPALEEKIMDHLSSIKVDHQGLFQEIQKIKKILDYAEKKFENLYTLIERIKGGNS